MYVIDAIYIINFIERREKGEGWTGECSYLKRNVFVFPK